MKKYLFGTFFLILVLTATSFAVEIPPFHVMEPTPYRISGTVSGEILEGVTITLSSEEGPTRTTTTDSSGNYTFLNIIGTVSYTLSASKSGYIFSPASQGGSLQADFTASVRLDNIYLDNDGTGGDGSIDNPYGTLSEIPCTSGPLITINLKHGEEWWTDQFNICSPTTIQTYGTGSEPSIINASSIVVNGYTEQQDTPNFYFDNTATGGNGSIDNPYGTLSGINWPTGSVNIHLKRGSVWNQLTFPESMPIKIQPYGTGSEPEIYGLSFE